jgi:hypothetical protein
MPEAKDQIFYTRASIETSSFNEEDGTVDVVFATETREVQRYDWNNGTYFIEVLSLDPSHVRMGRFDKGVVPVIIQVIQ